MRYNRMVWLLVLALFCFGLIGCAGMELATGIGENKVSADTGAIAKDYPKPMQESL